MPIRDYAAPRAGNSYSALLLAPQSLGISYRRNLRMQEFDDFDLDCAPEGNPYPSRPAQHIPGPQRNDDHRPETSSSTDTRASRGLARKPPATVRPISEKRVASGVGIALCAWYESPDPTIPSVSSF